MMWLLPVTLLPILYFASGTAFYFALILKWTRDGNY